MEGKSISKYVDAVKIVTGVSKKTGNPYDYISIEFNGGYSIPVFLNNDQMYIVKNIACKE